jgi:Phage integrase SAM-like domain
LRLYKRNKTYWFELEFDNKRYRQSTRETNRVKAEGILSAFRTKLAEGRVGILEHKPAPVFEDVVKSFLAWSENEHQEHPNTYRRYRTSSKPVLAFFKFKGKRLDQITAATIEEYKKHRGRQSSKRTKEPITPATINRELAMLKAMFFHAQKSDRHILNPVCDVELLPENNEQDRILSYDEQRRYLAVCTIAGIPGQRELRNMEWTSQRWLRSLVIRS